MACERGACVVGSRTDQVQKGFVDDQVGIGDGGVVVGRIGTADAEHGGVGACVQAAGPTGDGDVIAREEAAAGGRALLLRQTVVGEVGEHAAHAGVGFVDLQAARLKAQLVVAVGAAGGVGVATCVAPAATAGGDTGEHGLCLAAHQATGGETGDALCMGVVGHRVAVGGDGRAGFADDQTARFKAQLVVAIGAAGGVGVATCVAPAATAGGDTGEHGLCLAAHQATGGETGDALCMGVVGHRVAVGGDGRAGFADGQAAVGVSDAVIAEQGAAGARQAQVVGVGCGAGVCARTVAADAEAVVALFARDGGPRVGLDKAAVGDGVVRAGHGQGSGCHAHRCAVRGPVVVAGQ